MAPRHGQHSGTALRTRRREEAQCPRVGVGRYGGAPFPPVHREPRPSDAKGRPQSGHGDRARSFRRRLAPAEPFEERTPRACISVRWSRRRGVNACEPDFRSCDGRRRSRPAPSCDLAALRVGADFNPYSHTVPFLTSKSGKAATSSSAMKAVCAVPVAGAGKLRRRRFVGEGNGRHGAVPSGCADRQACEHAQISRPYRYHILRPTGRAMP